MLNELLLYRPLAPITYRSRGVNHFERRVQRAEERAVEVAAQIHAAAYVTHIAMTLTAGLSADEDRMVRQAPLSEFRLSIIADTFASIAVRKVASLER